MAKTYLKNNPVEEKNDMEKLEGFSMKQTDYNEYQELIKALNIDIKII